MEYPIHGDPDYSPTNQNPYSGDIKGQNRGEPYFTDLAGRSTMVSDVVEMTKRMKAFVPESSAKQGKPSK